MERFKVGCLLHSGAYILRFKKPQTSGGELFMLQALSWLTIVQHYTSQGWGGGWVGGAVYFAQALQKAR